MNKTTDDLISRAAAIKALGERPHLWTNSEAEFAEMRAWESHKSAIENINAVDAVPVKHGRWIFHDDDIMPWVSCSVCGICTDSLNETSYCPRCGAKMEIKNA